MQENVYDRFIGKLRRRIENLRIGGPLDKCIDIGAINSERQLNVIKVMTRRRMAMSRAIY